MENLVCRVTCTRSKHNNINNVLRLRRRDVAHERR